LILDRTESFPKFTFLLKNLLYLQSIFNIGLPINKSSISVTDTSFADAFLKLRDGQ